MDYTTQPIGKKIYRGEIQQCPHCGKNCLASRTNNTMFFIHKEEVVAKPNGDAEIVYQECPHQKIEETPELNQPK